MTEEELIDLVVNQGYIGITRNGIKVLFLRKSCGDYIYISLTCENSTNLARGTRLPYDRPLYYYSCDTDDWDIIDAEPRPEGFDFSPFELISSNYY